MKEVTKMTWSIWKCLGAGMALAGTCLSFFSDEIIMWDDKQEQEKRMREIAREEAKKVAVKKSEGQ